MECAGTGTIAHPDGLSLTHAHVARRQPFEVVLHDGRRLPAHVEGIDASPRLAALRIEAHGLTAIRFGSFDRLRAGELVLAVGHPEVSKVVRRLAG